MTSRMMMRVVGGIVLGALGLATIGALIPAREAHSASRQRASELWPRIAPLAGQSGTAQVAAEVKARAPIVRVQLLVDGKTVGSKLVRYDALRQRVVYTPASLAPGLHAAHLTVWDRAGYYGWQQWSFRVPAAVAPAGPTLAVDKASVRAGDTVRVSGQGFQPGVRISLSLGGVHSGAGGDYGSAVVDSAGRFSIPVTLRAYPDGSALKRGPIGLLSHAGWSSPSSESQKATVQLQIVS